MWMCLPVWRKCTSLQPGFSFPIIPDHFSCLQSPVDWLHQTPTSVEYMYKMTEMMKIILMMMAIHLKGVHSTYNSLLSAAAKRSPKLTKVHWKLKIVIRHLLEVWHVSDWFGGDGRGDANHFSSQDGDEGRSSNGGDFFSCLWGWFGGTFFGRKEENVKYILCSGWWWWWWFWW